MAKIAVWEFEGEAVFDGQSMYAEAAPRADKALASGTLECELTPHDVNNAVLFTNGVPERQSGSFEVALGTTGAVELRCSNAGVVPIRMTTPEGFAVEGERLQITVSWGERVSFSVVNITRLIMDPDTRSAGYVIIAPWRARMRVEPGAMLTFAAAHGGKEPFFSGVIHKVTISDSIDDPTVEPPSASVYDFEAHRRRPIRPRRLLRPPSGAQGAGLGPALGAAMGQGRVRVATALGDRLINDLCPGDEILTRDHGMQPLRWVGQAGLDWTALKKSPHLSPIVIRRGALGEGLPEADLSLPPNHRLVAQYGAHEVLLCVKKLVGQKGVFEAEAMGARYTHLLFEQTEIYLANGIWVEAFNPADDLRGGIFEALREELAALFPELDDAVTGA